MNNNLNDQYRERRSSLLRDIRQLSETNFEETALKVFRLQAQFNPLYRQFLQLLACDPTTVKELSLIPFLPISFFKSQQIKTGNWEAVADFTSSGTTASTTSHHLLKDESWYKQNARRGFEQFYGPVHHYCILALLPSYLERTGSSLVFMVDDFIRQSRYKESGFFLNNTEDLILRLDYCRQRKIPTLLIGVSFALLELAEKHAPALTDVIIMETGGMKGRRKELTRNELHFHLKTAFHVNEIHSEYGMTELLSQAYSKGEGIFYPSPTMRVLTREINDPFNMIKNTTGVISIIDLANVDTISFIATDDLGLVYDDGSFEVRGRLDASDIRGCNLMVV